MSSPDPRDLVTPQVIDRRPAPAPRRGRWGTIFIVLLIVAAVGGMGLFVGMLAGNLSIASDTHIDERYHSLSKLASDKIAVIEVKGTIMEGDGFVKKQIDRVKNDSSVKAVVLRVDSPGGTVTGSDFMYHHLVKLRNEKKIPIVVSMGSVAASGGYYVSMCVGDEPDTIFAEPTTWTGSIGVVIPHYDVSTLAEKLGLEEDSVKSHRLKMMGSPLKHMTDEERKIFQGLVDESFAGFKEIVKSGRPKLREKPELLDKVATGQVFTAQQALDAGLVDKKDFIEAAIERAIELAKLDKSKVKVVKFHQPLGLFGSLLEARAVERRSELEAFLDLTTPRAFYIFGWPTPGRVTSQP